jgi:uroporphyrinogen decarboxylase
MKLQNDLLLRVARGESVERPPVWMMRQAGRYLPEYMEVRRQAGSFREMIANPEYAAAVTLQPIDLMGTDAAIIFSDILVLPEAMGLPYVMEERKGPVFPAIISSMADIEKLHMPKAQSNLDDTLEAIRIVQDGLQGRVPLIGFAGAPWTIFAYMTEGSGSKTFSKAKSWLYRDKAFSHALLQRITDATIVYLQAQISAGVQIVQIFDSWAGVLSREAWQEFSLPYIDAICTAIQDVPKIVFAKGAFFGLKDLAAIDCEVIGLDWNMVPEDAAQMIGNKALQGNLDPCVLYGAPDAIRSHTLEMLKRFPAGRHIANLGHGIYPDIAPDHARVFIDTVKTYRY